MGHRRIGGVPGPAEASGGLRCLGRRQVDEGDAGVLRDLDRALVPIELPEVHTPQSGVRDQLEAGPAGARRRVDLRALDRDAVLRRLDDRVGLRVDGRDAVAVLHQATDVRTVREPPDRAVVARGEDRAIAHDHRADVLARAGRARGNLRRDVHEVGVPVDAGFGHGAEIMTNASRASFEGQPRGAGSRLLRERSRDGPAPPRSAAAAGRLDRIPPWSIAVRKSRPCRPPVAF